MDGDNYDKENKADRGFQGTCPSWQSEITC